MHVDDKTAGGALAVLALCLGALGCGSSVAGGGAAGGDEAPPDDDTPASVDPLVGTSADHPPWGIWTMAIQYGAIGEEVSPTIPLQVELRPDGSAYRWICAGAPDDGSFDQVCASVARMECMIGSIGWNGAAWSFEFPTLEATFIVEEMGGITPDGQGRLLLSYINPTYSGALFRKIAPEAAGADACTE